MTREAHCSGEEEEEAGSKIAPQASSKNRRVFHVKHSHY